MISLVFYQIECLRPADSVNTHILSRKKRVTYCWSPMPIFIRQQKDAPTVSQAKGHSCKFVLLTRLVQN